MPLKVIPLILMTTKMLHSIHDKISITLRTVTRKFNVCPQEMDQVLHGVAHILVIYLVLGTPLNLHTANQKSATVVLAEYLAIAYIG
jgi:hypothetical protein